MDKVAVQINNRDELEKFEKIAINNGWSCDFIANTDYACIVEPIAFNLSMAPALGWDYSEFYGKKGFRIITLDKMIEMFDVWIPKKGDKVLAKSDFCDYKLVTYIAEHNNAHICDYDGEVYIYRDIKEYQESKIVHLSKNDQFFTTELTQNQFDKTIEYMKGLIRK